MSESADLASGESGKGTAPKLDQNRNPLLQPDESVNDPTVSSSSPSFHQNQLKKQPPISSSSTAAFNEAIQSLNVWIWQCQTWMYFHGACQARLQQQRHHQSSLQSDSNHQPSNINQRSSTSGQTSGIPGGVILRIPSIRKRISASIIDYLFIHFFCDQFRVLLTEVYDLDIPLTSIDFKELESFFPEDDDGLEEMLPKIFWIYMKTIQYATLFYLFYLVYETLFLYGWPNRTYPGATLGKRIMGLRVVSCEHLEQISLADNTLVRVVPAGNISLLKAFLRTLVKMLPISNTVQSINILSSRYNRSYFDSRLGCLVVQTSPPIPQPQPAQQQQQQAQQPPFPDVGAAFW